MITALPNHLIRMLLAGLVLGLFIWVGPTQAFYFEDVDCGGIIERPTLLKKDPTPPRSPGGYPKSTLL